MTQATKENQLLQWHPAFFAGIQIELEEDADKLIFENEHQLGTKPMEIDVLIIKKSSNEKLSKNIGHLFQKHNIIEYKSPTDYLSIDDFYKVFGYACFYKSDTPLANSINAEDITISFVCKRYPFKLVSHLETVRHLQITLYDNGIYYIIGDIFPMQLIVSSELSKENNFWLKNLSDDIAGREEARELLSKYEGHKQNRLYKSVMNVIVRANHETFEEVKMMCEALEELMKDELAEYRRRGLEEGRQKGLLEGRQKGLLEGRLEGLQQGLQQGLLAFIHDNLNEGKDDSCIIEKLKQHFSLTEIQAREYLNSAKQ